MSETKDILAVKGIIEAAEAILSYTINLSTADDFFMDRKSFDAVCMNFIIIGEMADRISDGFKLKFSNIDWKNIKGLRNIIAHDYFGVDAEEIWSIIHHHIPVLLDAVRKIV